MSATDCQRQHKMRACSAVHNVGGRPGRAVTLACPVGRQVSRSAFPRLTGAPRTAVHPLPRTRPTLTHLSSHPSPGDLAVSCG